MFDPTDHQHEQSLLRQLRASGDPAAQQQAVKLQGFYHQREVGGLAADVYDAAKESGQPPPGWIRASEHPELLHQYAPQLHMTDFELKKMLHPEGSGFRAEIYLPDPKVLGPGYIPVVLFKGSAGEVMTSQGLRDTTQEDFLANNFPQSVGLETDYYDRAMKLAYDLKRNGLYFELAGHSLAGGEAAAGAAVTGFRATTWNAAGLHPETARRFGEQNGIQVLRNDQLKPLVTAYQVQGELLTNGVQENVDRMDVLQRAELGGVLKETSELLKALPQGRALLQQQLDKGVPLAAQASVHAFVDRIAAGDTQRMLRDLPLSAGDVQPVLIPMTRLDPDNPASPLVARGQVLSLPQVTLLAGPVLETMSVAAMGAHLGERGGEVVSAGGQASQQVLHACGDGWRAATDLGGRAAGAVTRFDGAMTQTVEQQMGRVVAGLREAQGEVQARIDRGIGEVTQFGASLDAGLLRGAGTVLPDGAHTPIDVLAGQLDRAGEEAHRRGEALAAGARDRGHADAEVIRETTRTMASKTEHAAAQLGKFQHDAMAGTGQVIGGGFDATGRQLESATRRAPAAGAAAGALAGLSVASALELNTANYPRLFAAAGGIAQAKSAGAEATERHLMRATVLPSMDSRIEGAEQQALQILQRAAAPVAQDKSAAFLRLEDQAHPGHVLFQQARDGVHRVDADIGRQSDQRSENLAGALTVAASAAGLDRIDHVALSEDGSRLFAGQQALPPAFAVIAFVETAQAIHMPLEQSSAEWAKANLPSTQFALGCPLSAQRQPEISPQQADQQMQQQAVAVSAPSR